VVLSYGRRSCVAEGTLDHTRAMGAHQPVCTLHCSENQEAHSSQSADHEQWILCQRLLSGQGNHRGKQEQESWMAATDSMQARRIVHERL
jgi:hypothetical protein